MSTNNPELQNLVYLKGELQFILDTVIPHAKADLDHTRFARFEDKLEALGFTHACGTFRCLGGWYDYLRPGHNCLDLECRLSDFPAIFKPASFVDDAGNAAVSEELDQRGDVIRGYIKKIDEKIAVLK